ncbi:MAG: hypothetical protein MJZ20_01995 [Bacteroidaceae bacterium]|nr:hypothetical protein [Bacteroidaceae bacterium]
MKKFYLILTTLFSIFSMTVWGQDPTGGQEESVVDPPTPAISQPKAWFEYIQPNQFGGNNFASAVKVYAFEPQQLAGSTTQSDAGYMAEYINSHLESYMKEVVASTVNKEVATGFFKEAINKDSQTYYDGRVADIFSHYSINEDALNSKLDVQLKYIPKTGSQYSGYLPSSAYSLKVAGPMTVAGQTIPGWTDLPVENYLPSNSPITINLTDDEISYGQFLIMQNFYAGLINNDPIKNEGEGIEIAFFRENSSNQLASSNFEFSTVASITTNDVTEYYSHIANAIYKVVTDFATSGATKNDQIIKLTKDEYIEKDNELAIPENINDLVFTTDYDNHSLQASAGLSGVVFNIKGNTSNYMKMINPAVFVDINLEGLTSVVNGGIFGSEEKSIAVTVTNGDLAIFSGDFTHATITKQEGTGKITIYGGTFSTQPNEDWIADGYTVKAITNGEKTVYAVIPQEERVQMNESVKFELPTNPNDKQGYSEQFASNFLTKVLTSAKANTYQNTNINNGVLDVTSVSNFVNVKLVSCEYKEIHDNEGHLCQNGAYFDNLIYEVTPWSIDESGNMSEIANYASKLNTTVAEPVNFVLPVCDPIASNNELEFQYAKVFRIINDNKDTHYSFVNDIQVVKEGNEIYIPVSSASLGQFLCVLEDSYTTFNPTSAMFSVDNLADATKKIASSNVSTINYRNNLYADKLVDVSESFVEVGNDSKADMKEYAHITNNVIYKDDNGNYICPSFVLADNPNSYGGLFLPGDITSFKALTGRYTRTLPTTQSGDDKFSSVCLPFELTETEVEGKIGIYSDKKDTKAIFIEKSKVPAGTPCVVMNENSATTWNIDLSNKTISTQQVEVNDPGPEYRCAGNSMVGTYTAQIYARSESVKNCFKLETGQFNPFWDGSHKDGENNDVLYIFAFRAYLDLTGTDASATKAMSIMWEDEADGISELRQDVQFDDNAMNATMFNLNGQPVSKDYKGVVIVGGKKMLKK